MKPGKLESLTAYDPMHANEGTLQTPVRALFKSPGMKTHSFQPWLLSASSLPLSLRGRRHYRALGINERLYIDRIPCWYESPNAFYKQPLMTHTTFVLFQLGACGLNAPEPCAIDAQRVSHVLRRHIYQGASSQVSFIARTIRGPFVSACSCIVCATRSVVTLIHTSS